MVHDSNMHMGIRENICENIDFFKIVKRNVKTRDDKWCMRVLITLEAVDRYGALCFMSVKCQDAFSQFKCPNGA
jgi:hypothetical protein